MPSLLIVDDLPEIHEMIQALIRPAGFLCAGASSGEEALMRFRQSHFDVVLIDYAMEPMNGLELAREIHKLDPEASLVLMSGFAGEELADEARESGVFLVIEKPIQIDALLLTMEKAYAAARERDEDPRRHRALASLDDHLMEAERHYIQYVLERCGQDVAQAAEVLRTDAGRVEAARARFD